MRLKNDEIGSKDDPGSLLHVVIHLAGRVARTSVCHHTRLVPALKQAAAIGETHGDDELQWVQPVIIVTPISTLRAIGTYRYVAP